MSGTLSREQERAIDDDGLVVMPPRPELLDGLDELRRGMDALLAAEGDRAGWEGKEQHFAPGKTFEKGANRIGNLVDKVPFVAELISLPELHAAARRAVNADFSVGSVLMREPLKGHGHQDLHIDWFPRESADEPFGGVVAQFLLDDSTIANGAMRFVPGTHKRLGWPDDQIDVGIPHPEERRVEAAAGSLIVMNLNLWHAGAENKTGARRRSIFIDIRRRDLPQLLNQKMYLSAATLARLTPDQRRLLRARDEDPAQAEKSVGPGDRYREKFGGG
jgi:hypothetical protein